MVKTSSYVLSQTTPCVKCGTRKGGVKAVQVNTPMLAGQSSAPPMCRRCRRLARLEQERG